PARAKRGGCCHQCDKDTKGTHGIRPTTQAQRGLARARAAISCRILIMRAGGNKPARRSRSVHSRKLSELSLGKLWGLSLSKRQRLIRRISFASRWRDVCVLKIVCELVSRLIHLDVIRAGHDHHDDAAVLELLDR